MDDIVIRAADISDLENIVRLESACFIREEAAPADVIKKRLELFPQHFLLALKDNDIIGMINGMPVAEEYLCDSIYETVGAYDENGKNQTVLSLAVYEEYRHSGIASLLMNEYIKKSSAEKRVSMILNCREEMRGFYEKFGFAAERISDYTHGGTGWLDMRLRL